MVQPVQTVTIPLKTQPDGVLNVKILASPVPMLIVVPIVTLVTT